MPTNAKSRSLQIKILPRLRAARAQTWRDLTGEEIGGLCMGRNDRIGFHDQAHISGPSIVLVGRQSEFCKLQRGNRAMTKILQVVRIQFIQCVNT
jgi:hypothetical protein